MRNTPLIQTDRLTLRRFSPNDLEAFFLIGSDKAVNQFLPWFPFETMAEAEAHLQENYLASYQNQKGCHYAICLRSDDFPIGYVNVSDSDSFDLGYGLRQEFWGRGIVTEACSAVVAELRRAGIPFITATHDINNPQSGKVMEKIGMTYQYSYKEQWQPKDILVTFRMYQLNLADPDAVVYRKYWEMYPEHFIEDSSDL